MGGSASVDACDAAYDRDKYAWMPSRAALAANRVRLGLPADPAAHV